MRARDGDIEPVREIDPAHPVAWEALALLARGQHSDPGPVLVSLAEARARAVHRTEHDVVDLVEVVLLRARGIDDAGRLLKPLEAVLQRAHKYGDAFVEAVARAHRATVLCEVGAVGAAVAEHTSAHALLPPAPPERLLAQRLHLMALSQLALASHLLGLDDAAAELRAFAVAIDDATSPDLPPGVDHGLPRLDDALYGLREMLAARAVGDPVDAVALERVAGQLERLRHDHRLVDGAARSVEIATWVVQAYSTGDERALAGLATVEWTDRHLPQLVRRLAVAGLLHGLSRAPQITGYQLRRARWLHEELPASGLRLRGIDLAVSAERLALETAVRERGDTHRVEQVLALRERQHADVLRHLQQALGAAVRAHGRGESLRRVNRRLVDATRSDALTGAGSRRYLQELMREMVGDQPRTTGLVIVDVDQFKAINDTYGHIVGDAVLRRTADVIDACLRSGDRVFRYGGDEFVVLMSQTTPAETVTCAERIRLAVAEHSWVDLAPGLRVTVSVGAEAARASGEDLLLHADGQLLRAKGYR